jgi:sperm microtubule inner protein SPMIP5
MSKAIQCDVCRRVVTQDHAYGWRTLTLQYRGIVSSDIDGTEFGPRADVCSLGCATKWFEIVAKRCFQGSEGVEDGKERHVGEPT